MWIYSSWSIMHFWEGLVWWKEAERKRGGVGYFLMLSRRAAVLHCVAWGLFSPANLSMLQWPAWLWPPWRIIQSHNKGWSMLLRPSVHPPPHCSTLNYAPLPLLHTLTCTQAASPAYSGPLAACVTLTEHDRRQSLINHVYATGAQNII